jgi:hypothetical protein
MNAVTDIPAANSFYYGNFLHNLKQQNGGSMKQ